MDVETIRRLCLSFPHVTEDIKWGNDLLFRIGGKSFGDVSFISKTEGQFSFKCMPEEFSELIERDGIVPAPYVARYYWVTVARNEALTVAEFRRFIGNSYDLVSANLPAKVRNQLGL